MEFTLRTEEPFRGRIYTYGYYDRCFARGSGSSITVLKISGPRGFPDCGTTRVGGVVAGEFPLHARRRPRGLLLHYVLRLYSYDYYFIIQMDIP